MDQLIFAAFARRAGIDPSADDLYSYVLNMRRIMAELDSLEIPPAVEPAVAFAPPSVRSGDGQDG